MLEIAKQVQGYLRTKPRVRIVNRAGFFLTLEQDGATYSEHQGTWDWDSVSHPERNDPDEPWWSELWIIVYTAPEQWPFASGTLGDADDVFGDDGLGLGHDVTRKEYDAVRGQASQFKAAHTLVRAVIWCSDPDLFDPTAPATLPDGTWGAWSMDDGTGARIPSGRDLTSCRYWEF